MAKISIEGWPVQIIPLKSSANYPISLSGHVVLVFRDALGNEYLINAGPANESFPYGQLDLRDIGDPLKGRVNVVDGSQVSAAFRGATKIDLGSRAAEDVWDLLVQHAQNIHNADIRYKAATQNSNAVIGSLLDLVGIDIRDFLPNPRGLMLAGFLGTETQINFNYSLVGTGSDDFLRGRGGRQVFHGMEGDDHLIGGNGHDMLIGNVGRDLLIGGREDDRLFGGFGNDQLSGGAGRDVLSGGQGSDLLIGDKDADTLFGDTGADTLRGGYGDDTMSGGAGDDRLAGQMGHDRLQGGHGDDVLDGGYGNDSLEGETGDDSLKGGPGDDVLHGGAGRDLLMGEAGNDTFVFKDLSDSGLGADADRILDFQTGEDVIDIAGLADSFVFAEGGLTGTGPSFTLEETGGNTDVQVDVDGDGTADLQIVVENAIGLDEDDFIF